jgi:hypothetical protein
MLDFSRVIWSSEETKSLWKPRVDRVNKAIQQLELTAVYKNMRRAALQFDYWPNNPMGFVTIGVGTSAKWKGIYSARGEDPKVGEAFSVRTVTTRLDLIPDFMRAWTKRDDDTIGIFLGYPPCCIHFFGETWNKGLIDPTEQMAGGDTLSISPYLNPLLRWLGVRPIFHMPCSFKCNSSITLGKKYMDLLPDPEKSWALDLLSLPIKYDTLNGIGEITTPLFKLAFASQGKRKFEFSGYIVDGAVGGREFPYTEDFWTLNGFKGPESLVCAHESILELIPKDEGFVIDFGCGNGMLLSMIDCEYRTGIDINIKAIKQGRKFFPNINFIYGNINEINIPQHDLSIISIERFVESPNPVMLKDKLTKDVIVYSYSDGEDQYEERFNKYFSDWVKIKHEAYADYIRRPNG